MNETANEDIQHTHQGAVFRVQYHQKAKEEQESFKQNTHQHQACLAKFDLNQYRTTLELLKAVSHSVGTHTSALHLDKAMEVLVQKMATKFQPK